MRFDPKEIYEIIGAPRMFIAGDVKRVSDGITFHDTNRIRVMSGKFVAAHGVKFIPITLDAWHERAREEFNPQASHYETRQELVAALRKAIKS